MYQSSICPFIGKCAITVRVQATRVASTGSYYGYTSTVIHGQAVHTRTHEAAADLQLLMCH